MSTIIALKSGQQVYLAADSRYMRHDFSGIASDAEQKIFEIAPDMYIAVSGRKFACDAQVEMARQLANDLRTSDVEVIAHALKKASVPVLMQLVERLRLEPDVTTQQAVSGEGLLHGCALVGLGADGKTGYVSQMYTVQKGGAIECGSEAYFDEPRKIWATSGAPLPVFLEAIGPFAKDPATWTDPAEQVVERLLEAMKRSSPWIGGPSQVVCVDNNGSHWICPPPQASVPLVENLCAATIAVAVSLTAPTISISGFGWSIALDSTNGFKVTNGSNGDFLQMLNAALILQNPGNTASSQFDLRHLGGVDYGEMVLSGAGGATGTLNVRPLTGTSVGAAGGASALPATPAGYLTWAWNSTTIRIPYYN